MTNAWEKIFNNNTPSDFLHPYENFGIIVNSLKNANVHTVLDVACGQGRHIPELVKHGFNVSAFDLAQPAIDVAIEMCKIKNISCDLKVGDMFGKFPYADNSFDACVAIQAIYHGYRDNMQHAIKEMWRVTKPQGQVWFTVSQNTTRSTMNSIQHQILEVDDLTYIPLEGREKGLPHFYPTSDILQEMMKENYSNVNILNDDEHQYYIVSGIVQK